MNRKGLHEALEIFAWLFRAPLFSPDASARELQAIESEFQKKRRSEPRRRAGSHLRRASGSIIIVI